MEQTLERQLDRELEEQHMSYEKKHDSGHIQKLDSVVGTLNMLTSTFEHLEYKFVQMNGNYHQFCHMFLLDMQPWRSPHLSRKV